MFAFYSISKQPLIHKISKKSKRRLRCQKCGEIPPKFLAICGEINPSLEGSSPLKYSHDTYNNIKKTFLVVECFRILHVKC